MRRGVPLASPMDAKRAVTAVVERTGGGMEKTPLEGIDQAEEMLGITDDRFGESDVLIETHALSGET